MYLKKTILDGNNNVPSNKEILTDTLKGAFVGGLFGTAYGLFGMPIDDNIFTQSSSIPNVKTDKTLQNILNTAKEEKYLENKNNIELLNKDMDELQEEYDKQAEDCQYRINQLEDIRKHRIKFKDKLFNDKEEKDFYDKYEKYNLDRYIRCNQNIKNIKNQFKEKAQKEYNLKEINREMIKSYKKDFDFKIQKNTTQWFNKKHCCLGCAIGTCMGCFKGYKHAYDKKKLDIAYTSQAQQLKLLPLDRQPINQNDNIQTLINNRRSFIWIDDSGDDDFIINIIGTNQYANELKRQLGLNVNQNQVALSNEHQQYYDFLNALISLIPTYPRQAIQNNPNIRAITNLKSALIRRSKHNSICNIF